MPALSVGMKRALAAGRSPVVLLSARLGPSGLDPPQQHLALSGAAVRAATHNDVHIATASGRTLPFAPTILEWPTVTLRLNRVEQRAETAEVTVRLAPGSGITDAWFQNRFGSFGQARLDLWAARSRLEDAHQHLAGPITGVKIDRLTSVVELTITDGVPDASPQFPAGLIDHVNFPDAPNWVVGQVGRREIIGAFDFMECPQIDADGLRFYLTDIDHLEQEPTSYHKDGSPLTTNRPHVRYQSTDGDNLPYAYLQFDLPPFETPGLLGGGVISASGGIGRNPSDGPIAFILDNGNIPLHSAARRALRTISGLPPTSYWSTLFNDPTNVLQLVQERLIPQTPFAFGFRLGQATVYPLVNAGPMISLKAGAQLLWRTVEQEPDTSTKAVANDIEARCGRNYASSTGTAVATLFTRRRNAKNGSSRQIAILRQSQALYDHRYFEIDAADLFVTDAGTPQAACPAGDLLVDTLVTLRAFSHRRHTYQMTWRDGLPLELNWRVALTDAAAHLNAMPTRIIAVSYPATGPVVTFETEGIS